LAFSIFLVTRSSSFQKKPSLMRVKRMSSFCPRPTVFSVVSLKAWMAFSLSPILQ
jgi:hypothetical protein